MRISNLDNLIDFIMECLEETGIAESLISVSSSCYESKIVN